MFSVIVGLCLSGSFWSQAMARAYSPNLKTCRAPTKSQSAWLDAADWGKFAKSVRICPIAKLHLKPGVLIASVWADLYYSKQADGAETVAMPNPILFSATGERLGRLPTNFPRDPPAELSLSFSDWRNGVPFRISMCVISPTASGNQRLDPIQYQPDLKRYETVPSPLGGLKDGGC